MGKRDDNDTTATPRESGATSQLATPATQMAAFPATSVGHAIEEEKRQVLQSIETWRTAWQAQDVDAYIAHYTDTFLPANGHSHEAWLQDRQIKLTQARALSVQIDHLQVQRLDDQRWKVTFYQRYQSSTYADQVSKELLMIKMGDQYLIEKERAW
jgi:murein L,D-transpeptidase YafK